jgi:hypothetical protein
VDYELTEGVRGLEVVLIEREAIASQAGAPYWQRNTDRDVERFDAANLGGGRLRRGWPTGVPGAIRPASGSPCTSAARTCGARSSARGSGLCLC